MNAHPSTIKAMQKLWVSLPVRVTDDGGDPTARQIEILDAYCEPLAEFSHDAIYNTVLALRAGKIEEASKHFCPKAPELADYVRKEQARLNASRRERQLPKPETSAACDYDHRMKMLGLLRKLRRALDGDREAQRELEPYGWKP